MLSGNGLLTVSISAEQKEKHEINCVSKVFCIEWLFGRLYLSLLKIHFNFLLFDIRF